MSKSTGAAGRISSCHTDTSTNTAAPAPITGTTRRFVAAAARGGTGEPQCHQHRKVGHPHPNARWPQDGWQRAPQPVTRPARTGQARQRQARPAPRRSGAERRRRTQHATAPAASSPAGARFCAPTFYRRPAGWEQQRRARPPRLTAVGHASRRMRSARAGARRSLGPHAGGALTGGYQLVSSWAVLRPSTHVPSWSRSTPPRQDKIRTKPLQIATTSGSCLRSQV